MYIDIHVYDILHVLPIFSSGCASMYTVYMTLFVHIPTGTFFGSATTDLGGAAFVLYPDFHKSYCSNGLNSKAENVVDSLFPQLRRRKIQLYGKQHHTQFSTNYCSLE